MKIYLAARYSRRLELCDYRDQLQALGHEVTATWLDGQHQIDESGRPIGDHGEKLVEAGDEENASRLREKFARDDFRDVMLCDLLIAFTEEPRGKASRGGRHVEFGVALGMMKRVWVVGPRENLFYWMEYVMCFDTFSDVLALLEMRR